MWRICLFLGAYYLSIGFIAPSHAQENAVTITSPQPVSLLRGRVNIIGSANIDNQTGYRVQWRQLNDDLTPLNGENGFWSPAVLPQNQRVLDDVLGAWNTTLVADGIYELQLIVIRKDNTTEIFILRPVRVENAYSPHQGGRFLNSF